MGIVGQSAGGKSLLQLAIKIEGTVVLLVEQKLVGSGEQCLFQPGTAGRALPHLLERRQHRFLIVRGALQFQQHVEALGIGLAGGVGHGFDEAPGFLAAAAAEQSVAQGGFNGRPVRCAGFIQQTAISIGGFAVPFAAAQQVGAPFAVAE